MSIVNTFECTAVPFQICPIRPSLQTLCT